MIIGPGPSPWPLINIRGWWFGLAPDTREFWFRFPKKRNHAHPVSIYRVPHGSQPAHSFRSLQ